MMNETLSTFVRGKIVAICQAILNEEIGVIAGSRILNRLEFELIDYPRGQFDRDDDFTPFVAIDSQTDHLPVDHERANWSAEALVRKDQEIAESEALFKETAFAACQNLIARFDMKSGA
jgi:hypothetical protein